MRNAAGAFLAAVTAVFSTQVATQLLPAGTAAVASTATIEMRRAKDAPAVTLTYPPANAIFALDVSPTLPLQASASDPDETLLGVAFWVCPANGMTCAGSATMIGVASAAPYQVQWTPSPANTGPYLVMAQAQNAAGQPANSAWVPITLAQYVDVPRASIVAPVAPRWFFAPAAPLIYATATPGNTTPASSIARVDLIADGSVVASLSASNVASGGYAFVWTQAPRGPHQLFVRATDSLARQAVSAPIDLYVDDPDPAPRVVLTSPVTGATYTSASTIQLSASAIASPEAIERVEFVQGTLVLATAYGPPYAASWIAPPPGQFAIVARAVDHFGLSTTSPAAHVQVLSRPRAPAVVLTSPAPGSTVPAGAAVSLAATTIAPDSSVSRIDFFVDGALLGSTATAPYTYVWTNPQVGSRTLVARAYETYGSSGSSSSVSVNVAGSLLPTVVLTAPATGATFNAPASIGIAATAAESGGTIAKVDFFANGNSIGTKTASPYATTWSGVPAGSYSLTARTTDAVGATATSAPVVVTVLPPAPTITLAGPSSAASYRVGQTIPITAQVATPGTTITSIRFTVDGAVIGTLAPSGQSTGTFTLSWTPATPGNRTIAVQVLAASGASVSTPTLSITVSDLAVSLAEPWSGEAYEPGTPIQLTAIATTSVGSIDHVEFVVDGAVVGASASMPYRTVWNGGGTGSHSVSAKVYDAGGLVVSAAPLSVTIAPPSLQLAPGLDGSSIADDSIAVAGNVQAPVNASVIVAGRGAVLAPDGSFFVDDVRLQPGANSVPVTLITEQSQPLVRTLSVTSSGQAPFEVSLDRQQGLAPLDVHLTVRNRTGIAFGRIEIDSTDDGAPDFVLTGLSDNAQTLDLAYATPGTYTIRVKVYDSANKVIYMAVRRVRALAPEEHAYRIFNVYNTMVNRLAINDTAGALKQFTGSAQDRFNQVFAALGSSIASTAKQLGTPVSTVATDEYAEVALLRQGPGGAQSFLVYIIRCEDGIWRLDDM